MPATSPALTALATTPGGLLLVLAIVLPVLGMLALFACGERRTGPIALVTVMAGCANALAIAWRVGESRAALIYVVGGWQPPLGLSLRADGLSVVLLLVSAIVIAVAGWYAVCHGRAVDPGDSRTPYLFWSLVLPIWSALNAIAIGEDLFNLYVAIELLTFAAVPLVCLSGRAETLAAALRYLLFALLGSMLYLLGAAIFYGAFGALDIRTLARIATPGPATSLALALMTAGLLAKSALFPLHLWLPPAHAGAPPAASAILSALVIKAPFFIALRLWFDVAPAQPGALAPQVLAGLGAASILFCSVLAMRQARLKQLIAYSTVAQIGYLFLAFPMAAGTEALGPWATPAWTGGALQLAAHAFAKAAMFMAAGTVAHAYGHDRIADLGGFGRALPLSAAAFGLAGLSLVGLPPSGGFVAKWMLLGAATAEGRWITACVILAGGLLAAGYVFRIIGRALADPAPGAPAPLAVTWRWQAAALLLAVAAVALGLLPMEPSSFLQIGRAAEGAVQP